MWIAIPEIKAIAIRNVLTVFMSMSLAKLLYRHRMNYQRVAVAKTLCGVKESQNASL